MRVTFQRQKTKLRPVSLPAYWPLWRSTNQNGARTVQAQVAVWLLMGSQV